MARILIAEDDDNLRAIMCEILKRQGHEVQEAVDGAQAHTLAEENTFDLLITDIVMPEKWGLELISELRRFQQELKIIAASAGGRLDAHHYLDMALKCGADETLLKPFGKEQLVEIVDRVLAQTASTTSTA